MKKGRKIPAPKIGMIIIKTSTTTALPVKGIIISEIVVTVPAMQQNTGR